MITLSELIRKPYLEPIILMVSEVDGSGGRFLFLTTPSKHIRKPYLELMILETHKENQYKTNQNSKKNIKTE